jgi:RNA polymerase sigma factor (sigma-70 family)
MDSRTQSKFDEAFFRDLPSPLSQDEQIDLAKSFLEGGDEEAGKELIRTNLRYVVSVASDYNRSDVDYRDLVQAGNLGLQKALHRFDPERGIPFTKYAYHWIRAEIFKQLGFEQSSVKIKTRSGKNIVQNIKKSENELIEEGKEVNNENLAEKLDEDPEEVRKVRAGMNVFSLDKNISGMDEKTYLDQLESGDSHSPNEAEQKLISEDIQNIFDRFAKEEIEKNRERDVWNNRILDLDPEPLRVFAEKWDVTPTRISQIEGELESNFQDWVEGQTKESLLH